MPASNGFECKTCHDEANFPNRLAVTSVPFPSGVSLTFSTQKDANGALIPVDANLCIECHQGRESTVTVNNALAAFAAAVTPARRVSRLDESIESGMSTRGARVPTRKRIASSWSTSLFEISSTFTSRKCAPDLT